VKCVKHVIELSGEIKPDLEEILSVAESWANGNASVGETRKAAVRAIALANASTDSAKTAIARAAGHAVATAHMADHSLGGAMYGLRAVSLLGASVEAERKWQNDQLPEEIRELVLSGRKEKERHFHF